MEIAQCVLVLADTDKGLIEQCNRQYHPQLTKHIQTHSLTSFGIKGEREGEKWAGEGRGDALLESSYRLLMNLVLKESEESGMNDRLITTWGMCSQVVIPHNYCMHDCSF